MVLQVPGGSEKKILLHSCCAPCSGAIVECMVGNGLKPVIFFSNSNICSRQEYDKRLAEVVRYAAKFGLEVVDDEYDHSAWLSAVRGLEKEPERGVRCLQCFRFRLMRAAGYAARNGFGVLTTSLASSRWKDLEQVGQAGEEACREAGGLPGGQELLWWNQNWRKGGLQPRRSEIIAEEGFYNQTFCGCEFCEKHD